MWTQRRRLGSGRARARVHGTRPFQGTKEAVAQGSLRTIADSSAAAKARGVFRRKGRCS